MNRPTASGIDTDALERETGFGWGWFIFLGMALVALGALAFLNLPTAASGFLNGVGMLMLMGAVAQLATRLLVPGWRGTGLLALSAVLYGAAGVLLIANPSVASDALTVMLALALILSGVMRMRWSGVTPSRPGWGWITASGVVTAVTGIAFIYLLPVHPVWLLGMVLAFDLAFQGAMTLGFGLALRATTR